ncbi:HAMP domain-containing sensor histidine kinase [Butyrivibrio sp. NC3005]|uniref:HAMP domain-containing sensor histidine kinase n=1 Tax=Butyrivibrio sp. NC3005 TaxID=1280685 RepID=UPI000406AD7C|nr:HAMP domain-containing sensor histidine kinase [Butyrivibrio sp. NC3005]
MKRSLYLKFLIAYVLFAVFGFIAVGTVISNMTLEHITRQRADNLNSAANQIANTYALDMYNSETTISTVQEQLTTLSRYTDATIWIINPSGRLIIDSSRVLKEDSDESVKGFDPTVTGAGNYVVGNFFGSFQEEELSVIAPISANYKVQAYVVIHAPMSAVRQEANETLNISYILLIILLLLSCIILIFFTELVYIPLKKVTTATEQYAAGNMDYKFTPDSDDEIGYLGAAVSYMAGEIARSEDDQRKFIANVSHDFRSPLTSIKGYLQAMQDGTIPPDMYEHYLGVVINETERLTKLTNGLLTLNNLGGGVMLEKSDFNLNKIIRDTAASFEGTCRAKKVAIELVLTDDEMIVNADMGKIQQVLYNLIDNAIKFSHNDAIIKVETTEKKNKLFVSVKDSGIGIPKEDQKLIFDRFYKSDLSRGKDKKGTGLGLSIVKEIIKAHGENINVISTVGVGTEFVFSLPKAKIMDEKGD